MVHIVHTFLQMNSNEKVVHHIQPFFLTYPHLLTTYQHPFSYICQPKKGKRFEK